MATPKESRSFLQRILSVVGIIALFLFIVGLFRDNRAFQDVNPEYQAYVDEYNKRIRENMARMKAQAQNDGENGIRLDEKVTLHNFEGPQARLHALEFWGEERGKGAEGVIEYGDNYMLFDPDHPKLGMPDIEVNVSPVRLYSPGEQKLLHELGAFFGVSHKNNQPEPYRVYTKKIIPAAEDTSSRAMEVQMQLWLVEFKVTISAKPDRKWKGSLDEREKNRKAYPGRWYGHGLGASLSAAELAKEDDNNRYGNLKIWLRLIPNNAPWYVKNTIGENIRPEVGIGAVYCMGLAKEPNEVPNLIMSSVIKGKELALYSKPQYDESAEGVDSLKAFDFEPCVGSSVSRNVTNSCTFWNKEYYAKIFLKNIGTYREGLFRSRRYDDQLTLQFLMPILVEGSWDVIPPSEIIPEWEPPAPYYKKGISFIPGWGLKGIGKVLSSGLLILAIAGFLVLFFPAIFNSLLSGLSGIFKRK